jgi:methylmalonyl-CoA mutase cobalamin-binding subunit
MTVTKNEDALLSIGGLSRASGVTVETLRNWERRYGFPEPVRRASGHRRYTWDVVPRLQLIKQVIDLGYKPSFAVVTPVDELRDVLAQTPGAERVTQAPPVRGARGEIDLWLTSVERFDTAGLEVGLRRAWSRYGAEEFVLGLTIPFLHEIGDRWEEGRLSVAHEHFASETLTTFLSRQWRPLSQRARGPRIVLANLEGELHNLALHLAAVFLSLGDIEVVLLGPNTPLEDVELAASQAGVEAVVIGISPVADPEASARELVKLRNALRKSTVVAFGGNGDLGEIDGVIHFETMEAFGEWALALGSQSTSTSGR